ncbi:uncharacterized protein [Centruroides vittatus]|uniref:uncharacterized protein n=1 Tax=Centruroides vittatus TaxID=120091 RepID=UPI00350F60A5
MLRLVTFLFSVTVSVLGHGRLNEPPGRSTMWRFGFDNPVNYDDNELYCGGYARQWAKNNGKCGICGDPWDAPEPRANEDGGLYGNGIVTRQYKMGQVITAIPNITATHMGYFEFRLCPLKTPNQKADQDCLDQYVLPQSNGKGTKYHLDRGARPGIYPVELKLPDGVTCDRCVVQWHYRTGNRWGNCENGGGAMGCGPQETFRACSDVSIKA